MPQAIAEADLVISTTGASQPIVTLESYRPIEAARRERPLLVLDLAVPRDFEPAIGQRPDVYLYSIDDLQAACQRNQQLRDKELPAAMRIIEQETERFMGDFYHRATGPVIQQLKDGWQKPKDEELDRLLNKLPNLDPREQRRGPAFVRPLAEQTPAPAAGIAARPVAARRPAWAVGRPGAAVSVEEVKPGMLWHQFAPFL